MPRRPSSVPAGYDYAISTSPAGQVRLIVGLPTLPTFSGITVADGNVILSGSGGTPGGDYYVLGTTNITTPLAEWLPFATNQFDANGDFAWTNTPATGIPSQFYRLSLP